MQAARLAPSSQYAQPCVFFPHCGRSHSRSTAFDCLCQCKGCEACTLLFATARRNTVGRRSKGPITRYLPRTDGTAAWPAVSDCCVAVGASEEKVGTATRDRRGDGSANMFSSDEGSARVCHKAWTERQLEQGREERRQAAVRGHSTGVKADIADGAGRLLRARGRAAAHQASCTRRAATAGRQRPWHDRSSLSHSRHGGPAPGVTAPGFAGAGAPCGAWGTAGTPR